MGKPEGPAARATAANEEGDEAICAEPKSAPVEGSEPELLEGAARLAMTTANEESCLTSADACELLAPAALAKSPSAAAAAAAAAAAVGRSAISERALEAHTLQPKFLEGQGPTGQK